MFGTQGHTVEEKSSISAFLAPGIHTAKVANVEFMESNGGTPGIKFTFEGAPHPAGFVHPAGPQFKGSTAETVYWLSPKAWTFTKDRLVIMADKLGVRAQLDAVNAATAQEYTNAVAPILMGKTANWKFAGKEIAGKVADDGTQKKNWFKAELAGFGFVEALNTTPSTLKFDEADKYDMVRLPAAVVEAPSTEAAPW